MFSDYRQHQRVKTVLQKFYTGSWVRPFLPPNVKIKNRSRFFLFNIRVNDSEIRRRVRVSENYPLATMITELTEDRERNIVIAKIIKDITKTTRQVLVLSDRRHHCEVLHQSFKKTSGLYMGGMKESDLTESSKKKNYICDL